MHGRRAEGEVGVVVVFQGEKRTPRSRRLRWSAGEAEEGGVWWGGAETAGSSLAGLAD